MQVSFVRAATSSLLAGWLLAPLLALAQGTVEHLSGTLSAQRPDGAARLLSEKSAVREGDVVTTGANTYAQIRFTDGGRITLRPDSQMRIEGYRFEERAPEKDNFLFSLIKGGMRAITGLISKRGNRDAYRLRTPTATVGIRGTDFNAIHVPTAQPELPSGVYVTVNDGTVVMLSGGLEQLVNTGQTSFSSSSNLPPRLVPQPPRLPKITPPPSFGASGASTINSGNSADCLIQ